MEETGGQEVEVHTLPYIQVLHAFCVVDPTLCAPASDPSQFVVTLQPYLKSQVVDFKSCQIMDQVGKKIFMGYIDYSSCSLVGC